MSWRSAMPGIGAGLMAFALAAPLLAGPPLETDDPDTPGPGRWEINVSTTLEKRRDVWEWTPLLDINYGLGERVQLKLKPRFAILDEPGTDERSGPGNFQLGVKWRFLDEKPPRWRKGIAEVGGWASHGIVMSIYPQVDVNPPGDSDQRGLVEDGADFILPMQLARSFGKTRLYGEVGYVWREHRRDGLLYGIAFEHPLDAALRWTGELRGGGEADFTESELLFNLGAKARLADHVTLLVSAGRTLQEAPGERAAVFSYLGLQFTF